MATNTAVKELSTTEMRAMFDGMVKERMNITADEFIRNYLAGKYNDEDNCDIMSLLMVLPFTGYSEQYGDKQNCSRQ